MSPGVWTGSAGHEGRRQLEVVICQDSRVPGSDIHLVDRCHCPVIKGQNSDIKNLWNFS